MNEKTQNQAAIIATESAAEKIIALLNHYRHRGRFLTLISGISSVSAATLLLLTVFVYALGWWGGNTLRLGGWLILAIGIFSITVLTCIRPLRKIASRDAVARQIGLSFPQMASEVLTASQLSDPVKHKPFSEMMTQRHLELIHSKLSAIHPSQVFPVRRIVPPIALLVVTGLAASFFSTANIEIIRTGVNSLFFEQSVPRATSQIINTKPVVSDLSVTLRYPEYLNRKERKHNSLSGGISAPLGTTVVVEGQSLIKNTTRGEILLSNGETRPLTIFPDNQLIGRFVIMDMEWFAISIGNNSQMVTGPKRQLDIEMDAQPIIRLLRPSGNMEVDAQGELVLEYEAQDDHGIARVDLVLRSGSSGEIRKTILHSASNVTHLRNVYKWFPQSLRTNEIGDVEMELQVFDDDTIRGPKVGNSRSIQVKVMTPMSRHKDLITKQGQVLDALVDLLAARLASRPIVSPKENKLIQKQFFALRSQTEDVLSKIVKLVYELSNDPLSSPSIRDTFLQTREDLSNQLLHEARLHRLPIAKFKNRQGVNKVTIRLLESAVLRIDDLILDQQFTDLAGGGDRLENHRQQLFQLLKEYNGNRSERSRRAVLDAIAQMEKALSNLQNKMDRIRGQVSYSQISASISNAIDLHGELKKIKALLAQDDIVGATALVEQLEATVSRLMAGLESNHLSFRTDRFGTEDEFLDELLNRIMNIEADQLQLRRKTTSLQRRYQENLLSLMQKYIDPLVKSQLKSVQELQKDLNRLSEPKNEKEAALTMGLKNLGQELEMVLRQGDLDQVRQVAEEMQSALDDLELINASTAKYNTPVQKNLSNLIRHINAAYPKPGQVFDAKDKRVARNQAAKQRHLFARTKKLSTWIKGQEETRFVSNQARQILSVVTTHMKDSVESLESKSIRNALESQTIVLDKLSRLRQDLRNGNQSTMLESRPVILTNEVSIPTPDDYDVPKEYRQDILDAMGGELPDNYKEAIKKYYETLVR